MPGYTPYGNSPQRAQLVQTYMVLHSQQTSVRRRLSVSSSSSSSPSPSPSPSSSPSPIECASSRGSPNRASWSHSPLSSSPISTLPSTPRASRSRFQRRPSVPSIPEQSEDEDAENAINADEDKLFEINKQIRATLTDLLNCDSVKGDDRMRGWVQSRLMDAQHVINTQKRRRISDDTAAHAESIRYSMDDERVRKLSI